MAPAVNAFTDSVVVKVGFVVLPFDFDAAVDTDIDADFDLGYVFEMEPLSTSSAQALVLDFEVSDRADRVACEAGMSFFTTTSLTFLTFNMSFEEAEAVF